MQWYLKVIKNYVNFSGRAHRTEYWMFTLIDTLIIIGLAFAMGFGAAASGQFDYDAYNYNPSSVSLGPFYYIYLIYVWGLALPRLAVLARRLHDTDHSAWWILISFVPFVGWIVILVFCVTAGTDGPNRFGDDPWDEDFYDEDEYDDEYYEDEYDDRYDERDYDNRPHASQAPRRYAREQPRRYEQEPPPRRSSGRPQEDRSQVRRYNNPEQSPRAPQKDVYDLNESFREPPAQNQRTDRPTRSPSKPIPENPLSDYKNPFGSGPTDQEKKQFDRFGLVDDDFGFDDDTSQRTPSRKPPADKDR